MRHFAVGLAGSFRISPRGRLCSVLRSSAHVPSPSLLSSFPSFSCSGPFLKLTAVLDLTQGGSYNVFISSYSKIILVAVLSPDQSNPVPIWSAKASCFPFGI
jgi:hypothetical protein